MGTLGVVVAMKVQSVRFGPSQWELVGKAADAEGIPAAQFIREAAWARAIVVLLAREGYHGSLMRLGRLLSRHPELRDDLVQLLDEAGSELSAVEQAELDALLATAAGTQSRDGQT